MIGSIGSNGISGFFGRTQEIARTVKAPETDGIEGLSQPISLRPSESTSKSFSTVLEDAVNEVDGKMKVASADQKKILTGETNNLHQAMISMQESSVAFSLMVEVRNKLVESYQELMRMQV